MTSSATHLPSDDPARTFCLKKYEELFSRIFTTHPYLEDGAPEANPDEVTDEQKTALVAKANAYASELEQCTYDIYTEPNKDGKPHAGPKYK